MPLREAFEQAARDLAEADEAMMEARVAVGARNGWISRPDLYGYGAAEPSEHHR